MYVCPCLVVALIPSCCGNNTVMTSEPSTIQLAYAKYVYIPGVHLGGAKESARPTLGFISPL